MHAAIRYLFVFGMAACCVACGGGGSGSASPVTVVPPPVTPPPAAAITVTIDVGVKQLNFSWTELPGSTHYRLLENADGHSGFTQVGADIPSGALSASLAISVHMFDFANALFMVEGCDAAGCTGSTEVNVMNDMLSAIGSFNGPGADSNHYGDDVKLSADGRTMAIAAKWEDSGATGINGNPNDNSEPRSGAVYVLRFNGTDWSQQAYIKASNAEGDGGAIDPDAFGASIALSADGNTLAVGANGEASNATGINGDQTDNSAERAGAVYVFRFDGTDWFQQAYVKASNTETGDGLGGGRYSVALSADGNTLAVGAQYEDSAATGIDGDQTNNSADAAGATYVFRFDGTDWFQQAYIKASNADAGDGFGESPMLSANGNTLTVGAPGEDSNSVGINGAQNDNSAANAGATYVFRFDGTGWAQTAYLKASNPDAGDGFGRRVALSGDGATLAVSSNDASNATGINGDQADNSVNGAGAAYVFRFDSTDWFQQAYVKASNTDNSSGDDFGRSIALSTDGSTLAVGARGESSCVAGVGGDQTDDSCPFAGAAYVFSFDGMDWAQAAYVKAAEPSKPFDQNQFGRAIAVNADGTSLAVGSGPAEVVYLY